MSAAMFASRAWIIGVSVVFAGCAFGDRGGFLDGHGGGGEGGTEWSGAGGATHIPQPPDSGGAGPGAGGTDPSGECAHPVCEQGDKLTYGCDQCVIEVCSRDTYCCKKKWDKTCIDEVERYCELPCAPPDSSGPGAGPGGSGPGGGGPGGGGPGGGGPGGSGHGGSGQGGGGPGGAGGSGMGGAGGVEPSGSGGSVPIGTGGSGPVGTGGSGGAVEPGCDHDTCAEGGPLLQSCDGCTLAVCSADDYCCTIKWDDICVSLVDSYCVTPCP